VIDVKVLQLWRLAKADDMPQTLNTAMLHLECVLIFGFVQQLGS
jgi:hypothetical protein